MKDNRYQIETACRSCNEPRLETILSLGTPPVADRLLKSAQRTSPELLVPLTLAWCPACLLLQIIETIPPETLFQQEYPYYSSVSESYLRHAREYADTIIQGRNLEGSSLVLEIACNDGYMLKNFVRNNISVLGIDPASGPAGAAQEKNIPVIIDFFTPDLADELRQKNIFADVIIANNVLAHVPDPNTIIRAARMILKDDGLMTVEVPWVFDLLDKGEFDTIYHQHFCYFSLTALDTLFSRNGLFINDCTRVSVQGGSLRLYINPFEQRTENVDALLRTEQEKGVTQVRTYHDFAEKTDALCFKLRELLTKLRHQNKSIGAYGAAAKAATLLHYCSIGREDLLWIADKNSYKHGKFMGENHLPIVPLEQILADQPDYLLLLSWNLADEIIQQQQVYCSRGGKFILPVPSPRIF